jgi:hypothetical protein
MSNPRISSDQLVIRQMKNLVVRRKIYQLNLKATLDLTLALLMCRSRKTNMTLMRVSRARTLSEAQVAFDHALLAALKDL